MTQKRYLTVQLSAPDLDTLQDLIVTLSTHLELPDMIAAIRLDEAACRAEMDLARSPVDHRRLH